MHQRRNTLREALNGDLISKVSRAKTFRHSLKQDKVSLLVVTQLSLGLNPVTFTRNKNPVPTTTDRSRLVTSAQSQEFLEVRINNKDCSQAGLE